MPKVRPTLAILSLSLSLALHAGTAVADASPWAPQASPPDLPETARAVPWIEQDPTVAQARSALEAARHAGAAIAASPHEWTARLQGQQRGYREPAGRSSEWLAQVERPLRVNGKAGLDRTLGELEVELARARLGEARHESARALAELWLGLALARLQQSLYEEQLGFAQANVEAVDKRRRAGDASALDASLARADLGEVQRQASLAASQRARAQAALQGRFPGATPGQQALSEPRPPEGPLQAWHDRVLSEADPLKAAQAQLRKARTTADRAAADRVADPTVGVFTASEASRNERLVGISLTLPLGGTYRRERALQALGEADVAQAEVDRIQRELAIEVTQAHGEALASVARWRDAQAAAEAARTSAQLTQRAYALGEADLQVLLLARRQALEAARAALESRGEALRWNHRLLVDAHLVWDLEND